MLLHNIIVYCGKNLEAKWRKLWKENKLDCILNRDDVGVNGRENQGRQFKMEKQEGKDVLKIASHLKYILFPT